MKTQLSATMEDYLEAIYDLHVSGKVPRVKDIAQAMRVKMPSVTSALRTLTKEGAVRHEKYGYVELTKEGQRVAQQIYHRHQVLTKFLIRILGLNPDMAEQDACQMEHYISPQTLERLVKFVEFVETFPDTEEDPRWLQYFRRYAEKGEPPPCALDKCPEGGGKMERLSQLKVGEAGIIRKIEGAEALKRRLLTMGAVPGTRVKVEKVAPLGDPMEVLLKGFRLSLRKEEAQNIEVEVV